MFSSMEPLRLNRFLAAAGVASRRGADGLIFSGRVMVNGHVCREPGRRILSTDTVAFDGRVLELPQQQLVIMLHKPTGTVTTTRDPQGRPTVFDLLPPLLRQRRLFPVGRLDVMSEGLLLLTTDGDLALRLTHPRFEHPKLYEVLVRGKVPASALETMRQGMRLAEGEQLRPVEASAHRRGANTLLTMTLRQGVNRQIRRMCRDLGLVILRLRRIGIGPVRLGTLPPGAWRPLSPEETAALTTLPSSASA
jgi:23S rRNA pseudouridine2605 synthase